MINDEIINNIANRYEFKDKSFILCLICSLKLKEYIKEKEYMKIEKVKEFLIFLYIFENNIEKIPIKRIREELKGKLIRLYFDFEHYKLEIKRIKIKIKDEEIEEKTIDIIRTIEKIKNIEPLTPTKKELEELEELKKLKEKTKKENQKKFNEIFIDNISLN